MTAADDLRIALNSFTASLEKIAAADDERTRKKHAGRAGEYLLALLAAHRGHSGKRPARSTDEERQP